MVAKRGSLQWLIQRTATLTTARRMTAKFNAALGFCTRLRSSPAMTSSRWWRPFSMPQYLRSELHLLGIHLRRRTRRDEVLYFGFFGRFTGNIDAAGVSTPSTASTLSTPCFNRERSVTKMNAGAMLRISQESLFFDIF